MGLFLERDFDDAPTHLKFGHLCEELQPHVRYVVPHRWRGLLGGQSLATYNQLMKVGVNPAQHGVMDIFSQHLTIEYAAGEHIAVLIPPCVLLGKTAGHIYNALHQALGTEFDVEKLRTLSETTLILLIDNADSAASNRKAMLFAARAYGANVLYFPNRCLVHQLFRGTIVILERMELVKDMSCLHSVFRITGRRDQFRRALARVVSELDFQDGVEPPPDDCPHRAQNKLILDSLLLDRALRQ